MGVTLEFYAAPREVVLLAVDEIDLDTLDTLQVANRYADFSLHLSPGDLELLCDSAGKLLARSSISLRGSFDFSSEYVDHPDRGAHPVLAEWAQFIAEVQSPSQLVDLWFSALRQHHNDPEIIATAEALDAVKSLATVCQYCVDSDCDLVFVWLL